MRISVLNHPPETDICRFGFDAIAYFLFWFILEYSSDGGK
jgi:hypothetical protein